MFSAVEISYGMESKVELLTKLINNKYIGITQNSHILSSFLTSKISLRRKGYIIIKYMRCIMFRYYALSLHCKISGSVGLLIKLDVRGCRL